MSKRVLDLEHLRPLFAGEPGELRALIDESVETSAALIGRLHAEATSRSSEAVKVAHELKGLARTVGAEELGALGEQAEQAASAGQWDDFTVQVGRLDAAHRRLADAVLALGDDIAESE